MRWADLPDSHEAVRGRVRDVITRALEGKLRPDEILNHDDAGRLARWAAPEQQNAVATDLLEVLRSPSELGTHRCEAAIGLEGLAERLGPETAARALTRLITIASEVSKPLDDKRNALRSHPSPLFARVKMDAPREADEVRVSALGALVALARQADDMVRVNDELTAALDDAVPAVPAEAVRLVRDVTSIDVRSRTDDPDPMVRAQVLSALGPQD